MDRYDLVPYGELAKDVEMERCDKGEFVYFSDAKLEIAKARQTNVIVKNHTMS